MHLSCRRRQTSVLLHLGRIQLSCPCRDSPLLPHTQLFLGDTNRTIAETPMNQASSRSHCVFTVAIEARRPGQDTVSWQWEGVGWGAQG